MTELSFHFQTSTQPAGNTPTDNSYLREYKLAGTWDEPRTATPQMKAEIALYRFLMTT